MPTSDSPRGPSKGSALRSSALPESLLTLDEAAKVLNISPRTVRRLIGRGELPALRIGSQVRLHPDSLLAYLRDRLFKN